MKNYLDSISDKLKKREYVPRSFDDISKFPIAQGQAMYVLDLINKKISFQNGITEFLGYLPHEFTFDHVISLIHPRDYDLVLRLFRATLQYASKNDVSHTVSYCVTYRIKHKNGNYVKVLRQSNVFESDIDGKIISNISILTDISFIDISEKVQWKFIAPGLDIKKFKKYVTKEYTGLFSEREMEVLLLLREGLTSAKISEKLFISKHTVDGHRRTMLNKSNCANTIDLINFAKNSGLF